MYFAHMAAAACLCPHLAMLQRVPLTLPDPAGLQVQSSGLDALIAVRILSFGILLFVPITVGGMVILAVNYTDSYYLKSASELSVSADDYSTIFMR